MKKSFLFASALALGLAGCSSTPERDNYALQQEMNEARAEQAEEVLDVTPDWYLNPPKDSFGLYGTGTAYSQDLQFALEKAKLRAQGQIAEAYQAEVSRQSSSLVQESADGERLSGADKQVTDVFVDQADLSGTEVRQSKVVQEKTGYRAYILAFYPFGETNVVKAERQREQEAISAQQSLDTAHRELVERTQRQ